MRHTLGVDQAGAARIETIYRSPDMVAQRRAVLRRLALRPGEHVLDIGCGPGFLAAEMARQVAPGGQVRGIDFSEPMLELARQRCAHLSCASFEGAFATDLPYVNERFDVAVAAQVYGYLRDTEAALAELYRVLRPGGRALILDTDWGSLVWHARDEARLRRVLRVWQGHQPHPDLPRRLTPLLRQAGLTVTGREIVPLFNPDYHPDAYSHGLIQALVEYVSGRGGLSDDEVAAWADEQAELGRDGGFFFSLNRYVFLVERPLEG